MAGEGVSTAAVRRSILLGILLFAVFGLLMLRILLIQTLDFDKYQNKVLNQMTTESAVAADRGKIYDRNGNVLATNITTYRVFISPSGIKTEQEAIGYDNKVQYAEIISYGLAQLLGVSYDDVYKQATEYTKYLDRTIQRKVMEETADSVREFVAQYGLENMVYLEAQSTRYYPGNSLGAHMIGFTSSDGIGLYGLEYQYDEYLKGVDGYYILARDSYGKEMPYEYSSYIEAVDGYNLNTTIDTTIQSFLEEQLALTVTESAARNRACGIVMNVKTGAVLAMATSSPFDLNDPWKLDPLSQMKLETSGLSPESEEYNNLNRELLMTMWSNKAITESYIPGSTFKIITSSMALEEGKISMTEQIDCNGYLKVLDRRIHCHVRNGHGAMTFAQGLQQSCNVWFMTLGQRVGVEKYQSYVNAFGYLEKTGIDLPGEGNSIFASEMSVLDLSIYAFGQNFNVTPMQQITAISAVANGGNLVTPYLVESIYDNAGNVVYTHQNEVKRQVVSEEVCKTLADILEDGVSGGGGAKNAYVAGYRVAAKTGTSEKKTQGSEGMYICSSVAFAPADDPEIAIIIIVDEPTEGVLYGSTVAAPYIAGALKNILPYYGVDKVLGDGEQSRDTVTVANYVGWRPNVAQNYVEKAGLKYKIIGEGNLVTKQIPPVGTEIDKTQGIIVLYLGDNPTEGAPTVTVPKLVGKTAVAANQLLANTDLNIRIEGAQNNMIGAQGATVIAQSHAPGTQVLPGTVITVTFRYMDGDEEPDYLE